MYRLILALTLSLMLTSCAFGSKGLRGTVPTLTIPSEYLIKCPAVLPILELGSKEAAQDNNQERTRMYHWCRQKDDALIDELLKQGVKGT